MRCSFLFSEFKIVFLKAEGNGKRSIKEVATYLNDFAAARQISIRSIREWRLKLLKNSDWMPVGGEDLTDQKFGMLKVLKRNDQIRNSLGNLWDCLCECGNKRQKISTRALKSKQAIHCGCGRYEKMRGNKSANWSGAGDISGTDWNALRFGAKSRNHKFELTVKEGWELFLKQNRQCALSGVPLSFGKEGTASLDRINSKDYYRINNVQWVHRTVNYMKHVQSESDFLDFVAKIYKYKSLDNQ